MIFRFNPDLFDLDDKLLGRDLLSLLLNFFKDLYLWDEENIFEIFGDPKVDTFFFETKFAENVLTPQMKDQIAEHLKELFLRSSYITKTHKFYLTTVNIGLEHGEVPPSVALKIVNKNSRILVENGTNDWNFIKGLAKNYTKHTKRKEIYKLVWKAIEEQTLQADHAGGSGEMVRRLQSMVEGDLAGIFNFKVLVLFDSDRNKNTYINIDKWRTLLEYIKGHQFDHLDNTEWNWKESDLVRWHMLYKRELESYLPTEILLDALNLTGAASESIRNLSPSDLDFYRFGNHMDPGMKNYLPTLFLNDGIRGALENRCSHHRTQIDLPNGILEEVTEIEKLLLNIAKII